MFHLCIIQVAYGLNLQYTHQKRVYSEEACINMELVALKNTHCISYVFGVKEKAHSRHLHTQQHFRAGAVQHSKMVTCHATSAVTHIHIFTPFTLPPALLSPSPFLSPIYTSSGWHQWSGGEAYIYALSDTPSSISSSSTTPIHRLWEKQ